MAEKALDFFSPYAIISKSSVERLICECAGIGRQASLRCLCSIGRVGSSPITRTSFSPEVRKEDRYARVVELADSLDSGSSVHYARAGSSPASRTKKEGHPYGCPSFLVQALLLRKSGRLRADDLTRKGSPTKVSLAHIPFLATYRSAHGQQNLWAVTKRQTSIRVPAVLTHRFCAAALTSGIFALFFLCDSCFVHR